MSRLTTDSPGKDIRVSAIVSTYNSERFIRDCLEDLLAQSLYRKGQLEIVVIDSASPEGEGGIVKKYRDKFSNIKYVRTKRRETLYEAWNQGIFKARGRYLTNANTDDRHRADALEILADTLDKRSDVSLVYADCYLSEIPNEAYEDNAHSRIYRYPEYYAPTSILHYQFGPQPMWRRQAHDSIGYFDGSYRVVGDYDFNIRFSLSLKAAHVAEPLGLYLKHQNALSFQDNSASVETQRIHETYRQQSVIENLYRSSGFTWDSPEEKADLYLDLGLRALEFYPPWDEGRKVADLNLALACFKEALQLRPDFPAARNNATAILNPGSGNGLVAGRPLGPTQNQIYSLDSEAPKP